MDLYMEQIPYDLEFKYSNTNYEANDLAQESIVRHIEQGIDTIYVDVKYGKEQIHERRCSFDIPPLNGASLEMSTKRAIFYFKEHVKSQLKAVKSVMIAACGNSFGFLAMSDRSDMYYVLVFISFVTAFWRWKRKMVASAFGEDQGGSSAPRPIGLFFPIASVGLDKAKVLTTDPDIGATLSISGNFRFLPCSHGDYLGSILETGIVRDKVRDIVLLVIRRGCLDKLIGLL
ncbi:2,3-bisphosphoglycerate-dependent phosphoglycerate mutase [Tanacetum coccineum]